MEQVSVSGYSMEMSCWAQIRIVRQRAVAAQYLRRKMLFTLCVMTTLRPGLLYHISPKKMHISYLLTMAMECCH